MRPHPCRTLTLAPTLTLALTRLRASDAGMAGVALACLCCCCGCCCCTSCFYRRRRRKRKAASAKGGTTTPTYQRPFDDSDRSVARPLLLCPNPTPPP